MNSYSAPDQVDAVRRIKQEIERLTEQQREALKTATYVGMSAEEARHYDALRQRITALFEELRNLETASSSETCLKIPPPEI